MQPVLAFNGGLFGGLLGLAVGIALSVYVGLLDYRKRAAGVRVRAQYRLSLLFVPLILAAVGAGIGAAIAH